jgi:subtilase family serine protease
MHPAMRSLRSNTTGLPPASLNVVNAIAKSATPYLAGDKEVTDTEMVHAIAPRCHPRRP